MSAPVRLPQRALQITNPVLRWLHEDDSWRSLSAKTRTRIAWNSTWASLNQRISHALVDIDDAPVKLWSLPPPVLIMGPWRSGSTAMHELLAAASGMPTPETWQCMNASAFRLSRAPGASPAMARPMDGMTITSQSPQEDEFALLTLGVPSAYRAFLMPHRIMELACTLEQPFWLNDPSWIETWLAFLRAVSQHRARGPCRRLLLKSPNHTFRLQAILQALPDSKIVWMIRAPAEVFFSNRKMWASMFEQYGLTAPPDAKLLDRFIALALTRTADALTWALNNLPMNQMAFVEQGELATSPIPATMRVIDSLDLGADQPVNKTELHATAARLSAYGQGAIPKAPTDLSDLPDDVVAACLHLSYVQNRALARAHLV